jgi:hypothetical protein
MGLFLTLTFQGDGVSGVAGPPEGGRRGLTTKTRRHEDTEKINLTRSREAAKKKENHFTTENTESTETEQGRIKSRGDAETRSGGKTERPHEVVISNNLRKSADKIPSQSLCALCVLCG